YELEDRDVHSSDKRRCLIGTAAMMSTAARTLDEWVNRSEASPSSIEDERMDSAEESVVEAAVHADMRMAAVAVEAIVLSAAGLVASPDGAVPESVESIVESCCLSAEFANAEENFEGCCCCYDYY